ncbi:PEP/pyruvate-binding domain-containing protein [Gordonia sp. p3-SID1431]|uniref:PEP/pyruvate-binding domain-containing protein n=1 Tax=Gordonia sp. p3-SID1431 TaxID=2916159 RepID=UPI0021A3D786|nr:PEP/pyruvate-binding domain-containing protein [Gordonia sp. p3-SID1431]MCT1354986.1 pyruvate, water dikinase [Gordonia sp. p3-SID1431]
MSSQTVEFEEIADDRYGGKAAGLARLRRLGLPVPPGYVIAGVSGVSDAATARFDEMAAAGWTPVAVRSSAVGEDGDDQSFAGQYDTVLGVDTVDRFVDAVRACADSVHSLRASSYSGNASATMNVVVQRMVDARAAGVVFTADPVSGRRDLTVIDVVSGLGEALVDGTVAPDHVVLDADGTAVVNETVAAPVLSPVEIAAIQSGARRAEQEWGRPMDLEWAIDKSGGIWWLQARPITTLPGDLNEMDSPVAGADHVYTRCNVGEMMPGAFCPLTASVSGFAIDYAMQMVQVVARAQERYEKPWLQVGYFYGHMFLNLTEGTALSSGIFGNSLEQFSTSICGRVIDELEPRPPQPFRRKLGNTVRLTSHALSVGPAIRRLPGEIAGFAVPTSRDPRIVWQELEAGVAQYCDVTLIHVRSSSRAAVAANVLESVLVRRAEKDGRTEDDGKAEAARLMAGASEVESALMLAELDAVVRTIAADSAVVEEFLSAAPDVAVAGLRSASGDAGRALQRFLERHGHRGYRELCMRDPSWADDPGGLGAMMQVMLRSALDPVVRNPAPAAVRHAARRDQASRPPGTGRRARARGDEVADGADGPSAQARLPAPRRGVGRDRAASRRRSRLLCRPSGAATGCRYRRHHRPRREREEASGGVVVPGSARVRRCVGRPPVPARRSSRAECRRWPDRGSSGGPGNRRRCGARREVDRGGA